MYCTTKQPKAKTQDYSLNNWRQQLNNCFEVNINSSRLNDLLTDLMHKIDMQQEKIMVINDKVSFISDTMNKKVKDSYSDFNFLVNQLKKQLKQEIQNLKKSQSQSQKEIIQKIQYQNIQQENLIKQIQSIKKQLIKKQEQFEAMDNNFFGGLIKQAIKQSHNSLQSNIHITNDKQSQQLKKVQQNSLDLNDQKNEVMQQGLSTLKENKKLNLDKSQSSNNHYKSRFFKIQRPKEPINGKNLFQQIQSLKYQIEKLKQQSKFQFNRFNQLLLKEDFSQQDFSSQAPLNKQEESKTLKTLKTLAGGNCNDADYCRSDFKMKSFGKKTNGSDKNLQFAIFSAKVDKLEKMIEQINSQALNKVMYPRPSSKRLKSKRRSTFFNSSKLQFQLQKPVQDQQFSIHMKMIQQQQILDKIALLDSQFNIFKSDFSKQLSFSNQRITALEEKHHFFLKKIDRLTYQGNQTKISLKKLYETTIQQQVIIGLKKDLKKLGKDLQLGLDLQLTKQQFNKQQVKLNKKMSIMHEHMTDKADKQQIKRALIFLEDKIKEIVVLIAHDQIDQKNGALSRLPFKCLSCDRDIENLSSIAQKKLKMQKDVTQSKRPKSIRTIADKVQNKMKSFPTTLMTQQMESD